MRQSAKRERTPDILELAELQLLLSKLAVRERTLALLDAAKRLFGVREERTLFPPVRGRSGHQTLIHSILSLQRSLWCPD